MNKILLILFLLPFHLLLAQTKIAGYVSNQKHEPLIGANVFIKGTYNGATTDTNGFFSFTSKVNDSSMLMVSYLGYKTYQTLLSKAIRSKSIEVVMEENSNKMEDVVITAGSFEAGEKSRAVLLTPVEIATTASSDGDVYGSLKTFPGVQKQGETGKIIVRGGDNNESATYMDGLLVSSPYYSSMPDLPSRGRFSPFMFNGVMFSTGGYSAEYGQALSSVLELKTPGLFDENITSLSIMNVGLGLSHAHRNERSAYSGEVGYNNLYPYFLMAKDDLDWIDVPESVNGSFYHRVKVGKTGMIKTDLTYSHSASKLDYSKFNSNYKTVGMQTDNLFFKTGYNTNLGEKWLFKYGIAFNKDFDRKDLDSDKLDKQTATIHTRLGFVNYANDNITLKFGTELLALNSPLRFTPDSLNITYKLTANDQLSATFIESDIKLSKTTALRVGGRGEYLFNAKKSNIAPRISIAQKVSKNSQLSVAWGDFYQQANPDYMRYNQNLGFEKATHYLINYQVQKNDRSFRSEIYYKKYHNLVTYEPGTTGQYEQLSNNGYGYARGIDLFWKDDKTVKNATYWVSYSFIDSKRKYHDYTALVAPDYLTSQNVSVVMKYWVDVLNTQFCLTYNYTSGRQYNNPNHSVFMDDKTKVVHDLSGNLSYITHIFNYFTVLHLSVSNILGTKNTYTYRFDSKPDENGNYKGYAVSSMIQRTIIIGAFISIK